MPHDQCPSTVKGENQPPGKAERAPQRREVRRTAPGGERAWRSPAELADAAEFRDVVEREFPAGASELLEADRRGFMKLMGASLALAGAATIPGCRRPEGKILAYSRQVPEDVIPGKAIFYATALPLPGGGAEGLLVETHEGRPTKIEGNPLHPINRGRSSVWAQACVLGLYDPDRLKTPVFKNPARGRLDATFEDFVAWAFDRGILSEHDATGGEGVAIVIDKKSGPSREAMRAAVLKKWPKAMWVAYDACEPAEKLAASRAAFGRPARELLSLDKARVVVSIDADPLNSAAADEPAGVKNAREFASTRDVRVPNDSMSRLYAVESSFTLTGGQADHRLRLAPSRCAAFAVLLARKVFTAVKPPAGLAEAVGSIALRPGEVDEKFVDAAAEDLLLPENRGKSLVTAGAHLPAAVHVICGAINAALGNVGATVRYMPMSADEGADSLAGLTALCRAIDEGKVSTLICVHTNPLFTAPGALNFAERFAKVPATITLSVESSETAAASTWSLPGAHTLESWGDVTAADGTISAVQPMIAPLYGPERGLGPMSEVEFLALLAGNKAPNGYELVRGVWRSVLGEADFDRKWKRALHDGVLTGVEAPGPLGADQIRAAAAAALVRALALPPAPAAGSPEVVLAPGLLHDGRFANVSWLHELPQTASRVVWDNPALVSPRTARELGLEQDPETATLPAARVAKITVGGRSVEVPVWATPGVADGVVVLTAGYGRRDAGLVGDGVGVDVHPLADRAGPAWFAGATISRVPGRSHPISSTQHHWTMDDRESIVRGVDVQAWAKHGAFEKDHFDPIYGRTFGRLNLAEKLGELSHTPPNLSIYAHPLKGGLAGPEAGSRFAAAPQWGMSIDMARCTGCGACTIACQAENNIPVVGKKEVQKGREMAWIRVDRYFTGDDLDEPAQMLHQPVACVHCENAPCEVVCPVNATVHGPEGLNYMTYNRCIGTRYCANNCPYKVRRFNFFDYGVAKFNGGYFGKEIVDAVAPDRGGITGSGAHNRINPNLIPPRLREKLDQISRMQKNPNVTVRSRGVMEKCTFCIQRINEAKVEIKLNSPDVQGVPDGFFQTACQQACPSEAIVFGDILDPQSRIHKARANGRSYGLLAYLNTRPRTTYMLRVRNTNPKLRAVVEDPFHHHGGGHDSHGGGSGHGDGGHGDGGHSDGQTQPKPGQAHSAAPDTLIERRRAVRGVTELSLRVLGA
jgi:molybdopterin-containing oxidoreductase family iron-sulfur binding subunit